MVRNRSDGEFDRPGRIWIVEFDRGGCGHQHRSLRAAQECYRRTVRAAARFVNEHPVPDDLVELVGDLTRDGQWFSLLGIRGYERDKRGEWDWVEDGWVSEVWALGRM